MADAIALHRVEEHYLVGVGDRVVAADVADVEPSVGEDEVRDPRTLFRALMPALAPTEDVADRDRLGVEQRPKGELGAGSCGRVSVPHAIHCGACAGGIYTRADRSPPPPTTRERRSSRLAGARPGAATALPTSMSRRAGVRRARTARR